MIMPIFDQALIALPLLFGAYLTLSLLKLPDFSIESAYLFGAVSAFLVQDFSLPTLLLFAFLGGMTVGAIVSTLNQCLKLPFLLASILTNGLFHGLTQYLLGTSAKSFHPALLISEEMLFVVVGITMTALLLLFLRSQLGFSLAIHGNNPLFFHHHRPSLRYVIFFGTMAAHGSIGIGGFLFSIANGFVDLTMNAAIVLFCLTALILAKVIIRTHRPTIMLPLLGLFLYFCIQQTLLRVGLNLKYFNSFQALFVLFALSFLPKEKKNRVNLLGV